MSGVLHKGVCYPAQADARQAACSDYPLIWAVGSSSYSLSCSASVDLSAASMSMCKSIDGGECVTVSQAWPSMPDCDYSGGAAVALDWGLVSMALLVTIWGWKKLIRLFDTHHNPD